MAVLKLQPNLPASGGQQLIYKDDDANLITEKVGTDFIIRINSAAYLDSAKFYDECSTSVIRDEKIIPKYSIQAVRANCEKVNSGSDFWQKDQWNANSITPIWNEYSINWSDYEIITTEADFWAQESAYQDDLYGLYAIKPSQVVRNLLYYLPGNVSSSYTYWKKLSDKSTTSASTWKYPNGSTVSGSDNWVFIKQNDYIYYSEDSERNEIDSYELVFINKKAGSTTSYSSSLDSVTSWFPYILEYHWKYTQGAYSGGYSQLSPRSIPNNFRTTIQYITAGSAEDLQKSYPFYMDNYGVWTWDKAGGVPKMKTWYALAGGT